MMENDIHEEFKNIKNIKKSINKGLSYYNTLFNLNFQPTIVTINSAGNYGVYLNDSIIYLGLDMYVGANKPSVLNSANTPNYIKEKKEKEFITSDLFLNLIANNYYKTPESDNFISRIFSYGKLMAVLQRVLPKANIQELFKYSNSQAKWVVDNEYVIWEFIVKNKLLFSNESNVIDGWVNEAPFTNALGSESCPRVGVYIGWRIVEAYMDKYNVDVETMLDENNVKKILASYKPNK